MVPPAPTCSTAVKSSSTVATGITSPSGAANGGAFGNHCGIGRLTDVDDGNSAASIDGTFAFEIREMSRMNDTSVKIMETPNI
jgi:hypothetical protein